MKKMMCILLCGFGIAVTNVTAAADVTTTKPQPHRHLASIGLKDVVGQSITGDALQQNGNWILIVLDATLPSAQLFLNKLEAKSVVHDQRTTVLLIGGDKQIQSLRSGAHEALPGVRWVSSSAADSIKQLGLPGTPIMLGITADQTIAWQFSGVPHTAEKMHSMIRGWLRLTASTPVLAPAASNSVGVIAPIAPAVVH